MAPLAPAPVKAQARARSKAGAVLLLLLPLQLLLLLLQLLLPVPAPLLVLALPPPPLSRLRLLPLLLLLLIQLAVPRFACPFHSLSLYCFGSPPVLFHDGSPFLFIIVLISSYLRLSRSRHSSMALYSSMALWLVGVAFLLAFADSHSRSRLSRSFLVGAFVRFRSFVRSLAAACPSVCLWFALARLVRSLSFSRFCLSLPSLSLSPSSPISDSLSLLSRLPMSIAVCITLL